VDHSYQAAKGFSQTCSLEEGGWRGFHRQSGIRGADGAAWGEELGKRPRKPRGKKKAKSTKKRPIKAVAW